MDLISGEPPEPARGVLGTVRRSLQGHLGWMLSLLLLGLGVKFMMIQKSDSPLPYFDQWEGEAADTYIPYFQHVLSLKDLFSAHNEHRIFLTRIYDLALLALNRQWDSQLQMVLNAVLHSLTIAGFGWMMARLMGKKIWPWIWLPLALTLVLPYGWENMLWGFQSQFYFMIAFSLITIRLLALNAPRSVGWRLGVITAIISLFTIATGFLAVVAVAALAALDMVKKRQNWRQTFLTLIVCGVVAVAGFLIKADVPFHHDLQAHSLQEFLMTLGSTLAWPSVETPWVAPINLFPLAALAWIYFRSRTEPLPAERMIMATGIWVVLQALAVAYARGLHGSPPAWRYMDTACFIMIVNCLSIVMLLTHYRQRLRFPGFWHAAFAVWACGCVFGFWIITDRAEKNALPNWAIRQGIRLATTRAFMATDDERALKQEPDPRNLAFPFAPELIFLLRNPDIRGILPACVRDPLKVARKENGDTAFVLNGTTLTNPDPPTEKSWGSFSAQGAGARGTFESLPIKTSSLPYLEIPIAGDLGDPGLSLELVDAATGKASVVKPSQLAGKRWMNAYVKAPLGEFKIVARDESETKWFAFKEPRELGRLSYWAIQLLRTWKCLIGAGLLCLLWNIAALFRPPIKHTEAAGTAAPGPARSAS